ncbi:uncharacterized protein LOC111206182 [Brassica napus]|uniref:uncharacterized protein LOC111206182 n=1 Tax=Brassica napus TaxID=3708 RepID=UPI000BBF1297|nr:uncharacterized protein LOC111206182 [Brassica napus]
MVTLETTTPLEKLKRIVCEDYGVDHIVLNTEFSYSMVNQRGNPPIIITNDRQTSNFVAYAKKDSSTILCVTFYGLGVNQKERVNIDLNKEPCDSSNVEDEEVPEITRADFVKPSKESYDTRKDDVAADGSGDAGLRIENNGDSEKDGRAWRGDFVKKDQIFRSKEVLKATMEILAMKNNFDYTVFKSTRKWWYIRCKDALCNWTVRAEGIDGSTYFMINQCEGRHSCAPSKKRKFGKTASARTIGTLIQHRFGDANDGPKANEIIQFMRLEHSCEITYCTLGKLVSLLLQLLEGRFMYLFMSFGQSVRGFYNAMRRVIVVDGTFLKNKYKGVLLVAIAVDSNSNLYPIAFGVVDSENDDSWGWFFKQLKVVIADCQDLAFVSDRNASISKAIGTTKGLTALVEKASRAYRDIEFQERITEIFEMSPELGRYLREADVRKWACSLFPGESSKHLDPLTTKVEKKIDRRIVKAKGFQVYKVDDFKSLVKGDIYDCHVDLERRTCTCGKYNIGKIPCRHAILAIYSRGMEVHRFTDGLYTTAAWRTAYAESTNPIVVPECEWNVPAEVKLAKVLPPETRKSAGRPIKRRYESVEDKIKSSQGSRKNKKHKCSRCGTEGHKRGTCDLPI